MGVLKTFGWDFWDQFTRTSQWTGNKDSLHEVIYKERRNINQAVASDVLSLLSHISMGSMPKGSEASAVR